MIKSPIKEQELWLVHGTITQIILQLLVHMQHSLLVQPDPDVLVQTSLVIHHTVVLGFEIHHFAKYLFQLNQMLLSLYVTACTCD